jgi:hypothetical protein
MSQTCRLEAQFGILSDCHMNEIMQSAKSMGVGIG